ncbi:glycoside hydrolase [Cubamyces menziesii]|nr:glycoside hydrolase [Cubamyces menziesii]
MISRTASDASFILVGQDQTSQASRESFAHDWSSSGTGGKIYLHGRHFVDANGRVCHLRGVNLSGNCKTPLNHDHDSFPANHADVTFVGRPFPLAEAPDHFARLRRWGLTFVRFLITWEAVEHSGPGIYDMEYLDYVRQLLSMLPQYGLVAFVALHQDVWSRYTGGSGAPAWTLEAVGFDLHGLEEPGAAWLKGVKGGGHTEDERGLWPCGYQKLAAATMATCFWAGDMFVSKLKVKGQDGSEISIQQFLQDSFLNMWELIARTVGDLEGVIGFEMMNEPHRGYIELQSMHAFDYNTDLHLGHVPTAFQSFMLGAGHPTAVGHWTRSFPLPTRLTSQRVINTAGQKAWRDDGPTGGKCLWEMHGVWGWDQKKNQGVVLRENYFKRDPHTGREIDWYTDFYFPLVQKWAARVRNVTGEDKIVFTEPIPNEFCPSSWTPDRRPSSMAFAPHWYCLNTLFNKAFGNFTVNVQGLSRGMFPLKAFYWGQKGARDNFALQVRNIVEAGYRSLGETPVVIGECGIPMDMNNGESFETDRWDWQTKMMDAMLTALERSLVGFTLWNYNPDNDDHTGDDWNGENFSWFSQKRALPSSWLDHNQTSPTLDNGGRILRAVVRPYPAKTAGIPLRFDYEMNTGELTFEWAVPEETTESNKAVDANRASRASVHDPPRTGFPQLKTNKTEIFLPSQLAHGRKVLVRGLKPEDKYTYDEAHQTLTIATQDNAPGAVHRVTVFVDPPPKPAFVVNDFWSDWGLHVFTAAAFVLSFIVFLVLSYVPY